MGEIVAQVPGTTAPRRHPPNRSWLSAPRQLLGITSQRPLQAISMSILHQAFVIQLDPRTRPGSCAAMSAPSPAISSPYEQGSVTRPAKVTGGSCPLTAAARALSQQAWGRRAGKAVSVPARVWAVPWQGWKGSAAPPAHPDPRHRSLPGHAACPPPRSQDLGTPVPVHVLQRCLNHWPLSQLRPRVGIRTAVGRQRAGQRAPGLGASEALAAPALASTATRSCNSQPWPQNKQRGKRNRSQSPSAQTLNAIPHLYTPFLCKSNPNPPPFFPRKAPSSSFYRHFSRRRLRLPWAGGHVGTRG